VRSRVLIFALFALVCLAAAGAYVARAVSLRGGPARTADGGPVAEERTPGALIPSAGPSLLFTNLALPDTGHRNRAAVVPLESPDGARALSRLACQRIHFAAGRGICLGEGGGTAPLEDVVATHAYVFAADFQIRHDVALGGFPTRVRISPDGRYGAVTVFVTGHSYAEAGFSTETTLIDLDSGARLGNLEQFALWRDGQRVRAIDVNFWGVTFAAGGDRFYATVATGGRTYLVQGSVGERQMRTLRENVECPSLSPDGTRLAFKKRVGGLLRPVWQFHVLDLATMTETPLAEQRSIDDQIEWLDDRQVLYGDARTIWVVPADGTGEPRKFLSQAASPTVLRKPLADRAAAAQSSVPRSEGSLRVNAVDLGVAVNVSAATIAVGGVVTHTVTVTNHGPGDATDIDVHYLLPSDASFVGTATATNPGRGYGCATDEEERRVSCDTIFLESSRANCGHVAHPCGRQRRRARPATRQRQDGSADNRAAGQVDSRKKADNSQLSTSNSQRTLGRSTRSALGVGIWKFAGGRPHRVFMTRKNATPLRSAASTPRMATSRHGRRSGARSQRPSSTATISQSATQDIGIANPYVRRSTSATST
jgi:uncharacterized repeat protein (TIGR01451 family)